jgi:uncharacterized DUF497 family protein
LGCEWDSRKNAENQRKHEGVSFEEACYVFEDPYRIEELNDGDYGEDRWKVLGRVGSVVLCDLHRAQWPRTNHLGEKSRDARGEKIYIANLL